MLEVILKRFENPDEVRAFEKGKFEIVKIGGMTIGRATYQPGWKWSEHVGPMAGTPFCEVEHVGMVLSGTATAAMKGGKVYELKAGTIFYIPPTPHDSWVIGDEPYVSLHFHKDLAALLHRMKIHPFVYRVSPGAMWAEGGGGDAGSRDECGVHPETGTDQRRSGPQ